MTHWNISPKSHPEIHGNFDPDEDIIQLWLGSKRTPRTIVRLINHETFHMIADSLELGTSTEQDHYIIDDLEASNDL